jgi:hypothetical protein
MCDISDSILLIDLEIFFAFLNLISDFDFIAEGEFSVPLDFLFFNGIEALESDELFFDF